MSPRKREIFAIVGIALLVTVTGCLSAVGDGGGETVDDEGPSIDDDPEELATAAQETMNAVETYSTSSEIYMETRDGEVKLVMDGKTDLEDETAYFEIETEMLGETIEMTQYIVGDTQYIEAMGQWHVEPVPGAEVWENDTIVQQGEILETGDVEIVETTTKNGHDVHIVEIEPDTDLVEETVARSEFQDPMNVVAFDVHDVQYTMAIDAETDHVRYVDSEMDAAVDGEEMSMNMTMTFDGFDDPVEIELPDEAKEAQSEPL